MVDESDYRLPKEEPQLEQTDEESKEETIKELEKLPWRPHGDTW